MDSTRLPGKVLENIAGKSMLARVVCRARRAKNVDEVVVATTVRPSDDVIVAECARLRVAVFRGEEEDVLDRYYQAARRFSAETIVRLTADCPLIDPEVVETVVAAFQDQRPDYASNVLERTFPAGLDTEVFAMASLEEAWKEAARPTERVHVTPYFYQNPDLFRLCSVTCDGDFSHHRWTVDTPADLAMVREVFAQLDTAATENWRDVIDLLEREPQIVAINRHIRQKQLNQL